MERRTLYIIIAIVLFIALFVPFNWTVHIDGTTEYSALMVKYISWSYTADIGEDIVNTSTFKIYFFPENLQDYETLRNSFFFNK
jgi:hypothetical protein